jgi:hypothetical protein
MRENVLWASLSLKTQHYECEKFTSSYFRAFKSVCVVWWGHFSGNLHFFTQKTLQIIWYARKEKIYRFTCL